MSYILDALKKAESERNAAAGPQLRGPPSVVVVPVSDDTSLRTKAWIRFGLTLVAAVVLGFVWQKLWRAGPPTVASPPAPTVAAPEPQAAPPAAPAQSEQSVAPPSPDASNGAKEPPAKSAKPTAAAKKPPRAAAPLESEPAQREAPDGNNQVVTLRELPPHVQNQISALKINGYIYSTSKADRTVLINNKLLHEGDQVAPELILEKLTPTGMVLNYKGLRYRASY